MGIAMEYVEGQTIEQILQHEGRLEPYQALDIISQVLTGISYAHNQGFIHRDLKPSNIIIDLNGNAKIMDFGISKSIDDIDTITKYNARPGTLLYMSPEQLSGNEVTIKSDLYSLAITLYEMIAGYYPYESKTFYEVVDSHINKIPRRISDVFTNVPEQIDELILRAMGKSSIYNFVSAEEFKSEVDNILNNIQLSSAYNVKEKNIDQIIESEQAKTSIAGRIGNFFLFLIFVGLAVAVYFVVNQYLEQQNELDKKNNLNYSQDYSKNPNYSEKTNWETFIINPELNLNSIMLTDNLNGFIVGSKGLILKTTDGGQNWIEVKNDYASDLHFITSKDGNNFAVGNDGIVLVNNINSKSWEKINTDISEALFNINFINSNTGFICGSNGTILKTLDGGFTWQKIKTAVQQNLFRIAFPDDKTIFAVGWAGTIIKSNDQGLTWEKMKTNYSTYLKDILFVNQFLGFIVGGDGLLLRTQDGGNSWARIDLGTTSGLFRVFFENNEDGMILSNRGEVFTSSDAGKTWTKNNIGKPVVLNDIQKSGTGKYIVIGNNGAIFKSKFE
jgi:serine/threonine-protein kinase